MSGTAPADRHGDESLAGAVALVTGGTAGIGRETARGLAAHDATVLVTGRDRERGATVAAELADASAGGADFYPADFADLAAVRDLAGRVLADHDRLDVLVNNAGTWQAERRVVPAPGAPEGVELTFAVNHLAHFLLTALLRDRLVRSARRERSEPRGTHERPEVAGVPARVVTVSSGLHRQADPDFEAALGPDGPAGVGAYALSKLANATFAAALARRLDGTGVTSNAVHPGMVPGSRLAREAPLYQRLGFRLFGLVPSWLTGGEVRSVREGARTSVYVAASPEVADVTGAYFVDCERRTPAPAVEDRAVQDRLWELSTELAGVEDAGTD